MSRIRLIFAVIAGSAMAWGQSAQAIVIRADKPASSYTALTNSSAYASVGEFLGSTSSSNFLASGTLVASDWVLTAAHVVDSAKSLSFKIGNSTYSASSWVANSNWTSNLLAGYDIALVHLATPVTGITTANLYTGSTQSLLGKTATFVGYGMTGTGTTGATTLDYKKHAGQNVIDGLQNSRLLLSDFDNPNSRRDNSLGSSTPLSLESLIAPGDSGGGVFVTTAAGTFLAGVNSFAAAWDGKVNSDYGDLAGYTSVSAFTSWITSIIGGATTSTTMTSFGRIGTMRALDVQTPEPSTLCLLASGLIGLALWRRYRRA